MLSNTKLQFRSGYRAPEAYTGAATLACLVGRLFLLALAVAAVLALPGQARAAVPLSPCKTAGLQCGTVKVLPAEGLARGVMFLIAGGPGQGSAHAFDLGSNFNRELMRFLFPGYTLVAFDNRGTGDSGLIRCPGLQDAPNPTPEVQSISVCTSCTSKPLASMVV